MLPVTSQTARISLLVERQQLQGIGIHAENICRDYKDVERRASCIKLEIVSHGNTLIAQAIANGK